jgi:hypothetical protein
MDIQEYWEKALKQTEVIRPRVQPLSTFSATQLPYIFLAESLLNIGDTVVRKGEVMVEKPSIILPSSIPQFEGFESDEHPVDPNSLINFLLVRGVRFPSLRYNNKTESLEVFEGKLKSAIEHHQRLLERNENTTAGLIIGPEDCWPFSIMIFIAHQVMKQSDGDIRKLWDDFKGKGL